MHMLNCSPHLRIDYFVVFCVLSFPLCECIALSVRFYLPCFFFICFRLLLSGFRCYYYFAPYRYPGAPTDQCPVSGRGGPVPREPLRVVPLPTRRRGGAPRVLKINRHSKGKTSEVLLSKTGQENARLKPKREPPSPPTPTEVGGWRLERWGVVGGKGRWARK